MSVLCLYTPQKQNLEALAESSYQLTPRIAIRKDEALFLDIHSVSQKDLQDFCLSLPFSFKTAQSDVVSKALALAVFENLSSLETLYFWASPFSRDEDLYKRINSLITILKKMGVSRTEQLKVIPRSELTTRFEEKTLQALSYFWEEKQHMWPLWSPKTLITETYDLRDLEVSQDYEGLLFILKILFDRLTKRLLLRFQKVLKLELILRFESYNSLDSQTSASPLRKFVFDFPTPQNVTSNLLFLIKDRFFHEIQAAPLSSPLILIEITALETTTTQGLQPDLLSKKEQDEESWDQVIARLSQKLGESSIFKAELSPSLVPERMWHRISPTLPITTSLFTPYERLLHMRLRPSRLLNKPVPLLRESNRLICLDGWTHWSIKSWNIQKWQDPERIQSEWWSQPVQRDYFQVDTESGEKLWVYQDLKTPQNYYLHGFFD